MAVIPKKIHYCWFGGTELPPSVVKCIESWEKYCPDFEIIRWDESNYDVKKNPYISDAYEKKKFAFVSDYARLDIIYNHGGIYLDTDVECIKSLTPLLEETCYFGFELPGSVASGLGFGAVQGHPLLKEIMRLYESAQFVKSNGKINKKTTVQFFADVLIPLGLKNHDVLQVLGHGIKIFPTDYFCPFNMLTRKLRITENTFTIHHYDASWYSGNKAIKRLKFRLIPWKVRVRKLLKYLNRIFKEPGEQRPHSSPLKRTCCAKRRRPVGYKKQNEQNKRP